MNDRYRALRIVAILLRVLAVIVALLGVLFVFVGGTMAGLPAGMPGALGARFTVATLVGLVVVTLYALFLWAAGAMINLFMDLERNTRATADMVANLGRGTSPPE
jgi:uncharacterized membrane protein